MQKSLLETWEADFQQVLLVQFFWMFYNIVVKYEYM